MEFKIKNRYRLKNKDYRRIIENIKQDFDCDNLSENSVFEVGDVEGTKFVFIDGRPDLMYHQDKVVFTLSGINKFKPTNRFVIVDMGAVKFVANGADVMVPGVIDADINIKENDFVWVCDERNKKALATGFALMSGDLMITEKKGKAVSIFHFVGDNIWNFVAKSL